MIESVEFNLDNDGFISQECPACKKRFKVQFGKGAEGPVQYCPYCSHEDTNCWMTPEQSSYIESKVVGSFTDDLDDMLTKSLSGSKSVKFTPGPKKQVVNMPAELDNDWPIVKFKSGERIKHDMSQEQLRCPVTGETLA